MKTKMFFLYLEETVANGQAGDTSTSKPVLFEVVLGTISEQGCFILSPHPDVLEGAKALQNRVVCALAALGHNIEEGGTYQFPESGLDAREYLIDR